MAKRFKPGEKAQQSGQYRNTRTGNEVTVTKGEPLPPSPKKGDKYTLTDRTKHKKR